VFTARYALSPYIKQTRFVFKGLKANRGDGRDFNSCTCEVSNRACEVIRALIELLLCCREFLRRLAVFRNLNVTIRDSVAELPNKTDNL
jgi:hypothetical protein